MESHNTSPSSGLSTHPHQRACRSCARAKVKCVARPDLGGKCQRCHRLKKVCEPTVAQIRTRPRKRRPAQTTRIAKSHVEKLEEKLDGLVTLLKSVPEPGSSTELLGTSAVLSYAASRDRPTHALGFSGSAQSEPGRQASQDQDDRALSLQAVTHVQSPSPLGQVPGTHNLQRSQGLNGAEPGFEEANGLLNIFRDKMGAYFPFIVVPQSMSAQDLHRDRPYLYNSILAVSSRNPTQQQALGKEVMKQLAERMFINGERSLDLLLGVLTYAGWCYYHLFNIPQLTSLLAAAMTLLSDLGLSRPPTNGPPNRSLFEDAIRHEYSRGSILRSVRTLEEQRALLGCFFLGSVASVFFHRMDALRLTPYIDECCQTLLEFGDHQGDIFAVSFVRLQMIVERIGQSPWHGRADSLGVSMPAMLFVKSAQEQLEDFKKNMHPDLEQNAIVLMQYHIVEILLYEVALNKSPLLATFTVSDFQRLELLHACLQATRSLLGAFFSIPVTSYPYFSVATFAQLTHSLIILQMLSTFDHPDWNLEYVRKTLNFSDVLDGFIDRLAEVKGVTGLGHQVSDSSDTFSQAAKKLGRIKAYCEGKIVTDSLGPEADFLNVGHLDAVRAANPMDIFDEAWLREILEPLDTPVV